MKQKKKTRSTYELLKKKYPYSFTDSIRYKMAKYAGLGLKEPSQAEQYVGEFFDITEKLLKGNYKIIDCIAVLKDDEGCSYGEMLLVKEGIRISEGIEAWKKYYLDGPGKIRVEDCKDKISDCTLHMNLKHIKGRQYLTVDSYLVTDVKGGKKKNYRLYHRTIGRFDFKSGEFIKCNPDVWCKNKVV